MGSSTDNIRETCIRPLPLSEAVPFALGKAEIKNYISPLASGYRLAMNDHRSAKRCTSGNGIVREHRVELERNLS